MINSLSWGGLPAALAFIPHFDVSRTSTLNGELRTLHGPSHVFIYAEPIFSTHIHTYSHLFTRSFTPSRYHRHPLCRHQVVQIFHPSRYHPCVILHCSALSLTSTMTGDSTTVCTRPGYMFFEFAWVTQDPPITHVEFCACIR